MPWKSKHWKRENEIVILRVVEEESELSATGPFGEAARNVVPERVRQHAQRAQRRVHAYRFST